MNNWTKEKLYSLSIFELRQVARDVGVRSPTILKKDDMVEQILAISSGKKKPYVKKNNKGRPPKELGNISDLIDVFMPKESPKFEEVDPFASFASVASGNAFLSAKKVKKFGYLKITSQGYGFLIENLSNLQNNIFVSEQIISNHNLLSGAYIEGFCKQVGNEEKFALVEVVSVNGLEKDEFKNKIAQKSVLSKPTNALCEKIKCGQRICISGDKTFLSSKIEELFAKTNCQKMLLNLNAIEEDFAQNKNVVNFGVLRPAQDKLQIASLLFNNALVDAKLGKTKAIFVVDFAFLVNDLTEGGFLQDKVDIKALNKVRELVLMGRSFENGGSLTIVFGSDKDAMNSQIILSQFLLVADLYNK